MENMDPVIYVVGFAILIPLVGMLVGYLIQKLKSEERLRAIEKGLPLPAEQPHVSDPWKLAEALRLAGLILIAIGLGIAALLVSLSLSLPDFPKGVIAASIPFLIGVALLIEHRARCRELGPRPPASTTSRGA
jgi:hypothetical protein